MKNLGVSNPLGFRIIFAFLFMVTLSCRGSAIETPQSSTRLIIPSPIPPQEEMDQQTYKTEALKYLDILGPQLELMQEYLKSSKDDPNLIMSLSWQTEFFNAMDTAFESLQALVALKPPLGYEEQYFYLVKSRDEFSAGRANLKEGIINWDYDKYWSGLEHLDNFNQSMLDASKVLQAQKED